MSTVKFPTVAIVGVGLLGASLGLALKQRALATRVVGIGRAGSDSLKIALAMGAIDGGVGDLSGVATADLVVLCTPVRKFPETMEKMKPHLKPAAIVTDVGSVKGAVMKWAREKLPGIKFVGSHPMAGSEKSGPAAAKPDLYDGAMCLLCSGDDAGAASRVEALWNALGMRTQFLTPADHDAWVALISHLPHAVAGCLVTATQTRPEAAAAAAGGFIDSTRIAGGDVEMWTDIFLTNRQALAGAITYFQEQLLHLQQAVIKGDESAIRLHLAAAKERREIIIADRKSKGGIR